ncbi:MAG: phenylacetate--CoA ligase family protein [Betaproteobacteria bacterium]|nr:phenylacetate--CoA ligase family protein [Betaproteobacteria bacterium]
MKNGSLPNPAWPPLQSRLPGVAWPAVPGQQGLLLAALLTQLEQSQWWPAAAIEKAQLRQLRQLVEHAQRHSRFHAERLAGFRPDQARGLQDCLAAIPLMRRADLQSCRADIDCAWLPPEHGEVSLAQSTGSTGEPVAVRRSGLNGLIWMAMTLREHLWQRRDFSQSLAVVRAQLAEEDVARRGVSCADWGPPVNHLFASGPSYGMSLQTDVTRQAEWLRQIMPAYLLTYPNNLSALLDLAEADSVALAGLGRLKQVRTIGETLRDPLRERCRCVLGVGVADLYSTQEVGVIAIECPQGDGYHVMSEGLVFELLRDDDQPCAAGEMGRVVVTDLHNFATPLIRYDLGDLAVADGPCACGRGLPKVRRILGRERNLLRLPDGRRFWPLVGAFGYRDVAPVRQYQIIQRSLERVTLRLAVERPLSVAEEAALAEKLVEFLGYRFVVDFDYCTPEIPRGPGGKFEDFICEIAD